MAVVIRGSFDEGPITLALPDYFDAALGDETDPIFTAWDKSTGITIPASQVSDFDTEVSNNTSVTANTAKNTYPAADLAKLAAITGTNTGDTVGHDALVPYTGASGDVTLGTYDLTVGKVTIGDTPTNPTDAATKAYVDSVVASGISWKIGVIDIVTNAAALPGDPTTGDRYITIDDNHIRQWSGAAWTDITPDTGDTLYVSGNSIAPTNDVGIHTYNGSSWVYIGGSVNHNDTLNIQGGSAGNRWHLDSATTTEVGYVTTTVADAVPTGLAVDSTGVEMGEDGTITAYVILTWNAISTNTFSHYSLKYKKTSANGYIQLVAYTNSIRIDGLVANVSYDFLIASVNKNGQVSAYSNALVSVTAANTTAPPTVSNVVATQGIQAILLTWTHITSSDLRHYKIYRHTANVIGSAVFIANYYGNKYMDNGLVKNTEYFYWIKAENTSGIVSTSFSTVVSATTRNVIASDVENIAATQVIIQGTTTFSNWISPGTTTIDGSKITTDTVTLSQLNFTPLESNGVPGAIVGTINASGETLKIQGKFIEINGQTTFSPLGAATNGKVYIFPNANTGIQITNNLAQDVFNVQIGGTHQGDVTIGNYSGGQGIWYDNSAGSTIFKGAIYASSGSISGIFDFGTLSIAESGKMSNIAIKGNQIWENTYPGDSSNIIINNKGYGGSTANYRDTLIGNGRGSNIINVTGGPTAGVGIWAKLSVFEDIYTTGGLELNSTTEAFTLHRMTSVQRRALVKVNGKMVYDTDIRQPCICLCYPDSGSLVWRYLSSGAITGG